MNARNQTEATMDEQSRRIGQKIRTLRQNRGMTQSVLAGDCITRNMLSLIESGSATPSLHTLMELSRRLEVPVGYFFAADEAESSQFEKNSILPQIHEAFLKQDYRACLAACDALPCPDQEIRFIRYRCHFALTEAALRAGSLITANAELAAATADADACIYTPAGFSPTADYLLQLIRAAGHEDIPSILADPGAFAGSFIPAEFFAYLRALLAISQGDVRTASLLCSSGLIVSPLYRDFITAKLALTEHDTATAMQMLKHICASPLGFFSRYHVLGAMEACAGIDGDFKSAYQYSAQKVHLLESFSQ